MSFDDEDSENLPSENKQKPPFEIGFSQPTVGEVYPIYGMVTEVLSEVIGDVRVIVNGNIEMNLNISDASKIELVKNRAFEPGIFVTKITERVDAPESKIVYKGECSTVIFGKPQRHET